MDTATKIRTVEEMSEEILTREELARLFDTKPHPVAYDGFEPSGRIHIAQGILRAINVNQLAKTGIRFKMFVADWHAWANNKLGGNLDNIRLTGEYFIETWKQSGMDLDHVEFVWANDLLQERAYWKTVMQIARQSTLQRVLRTTQIMGRNEKDHLYASQIFYPCMQAADIFELEADICQLGMDQRKVNVLAREIAEKLQKPKPVAVHHHMLQGLGQPPATSDAEERALALKMGKSNPDTAIFMTDSEDEIRRKINKAYCPEKIVHENPILAYNRHIVFRHPAFQKGISIDRAEKFGGNVSYASYDELEADFAGGKLHPADLKKSTAENLDTLIAPVREHFEKNAHARELAHQVQSFGTTKG